MRNTDRSLKKITEIFDDVYIFDFHYPNTSFDGITAMKLIAHLYDYFGKKSAADLAQNDKTMTTLYDCSLLITKIFSQIEEVVVYAEARRTPFTKK